MGSAIAWAHRHDELIIRDPKLADSAGMDKFKDCDAVFVCAPTPSLPNGDCDTTVLEQVLKELLFVLLNKSIPIICKSTAPPSAYERLHKLYPTIVHCPEFLTAGNNTADYCNAGYFVLGGDKEWCNKAKDIIKTGVPLREGQFLITDIKSAALYKYMMNSYLATKVTFMNEFYQLAQTHGIEWDEFRKLTHYEHRIGESHMDVPGPDGEFGWGGACFPKDLNALINESDSIGVAQDLLKNVVRINNTHRR